MLHPDRQSTVNTSRATRTLTESAVKTSRATRTLGLLAAAVCAALLAAQSAPAARVSPLPASDYGIQPVCAAPAPGHARCLALELVPETLAARAHIRPLGMTRNDAGKAVGSAEACLLQPSPANGCYGLRPQDLSSAYQLTSSAPSPQTIAIVDPYNNLTAEEDLEKYDREFGLPECTTQDGCFEKVNEHGETGNLPYPKNFPERDQAEKFCKLKNPPRFCEEVREAAEWQIESDLDIEIAHAICPNCHILLAEAASSAFPKGEEAKLEEAERSAARLGATEISNSWGEEPPATDSPAFNDPGIVVTAAAGDEGYLNWRAGEKEREFVNYPASSPHVVAVGGTRLSVEEGAWTEETVWNGQGATGGGCSATFPAPPWQLSVADWPSVGCGEKRAVADVSADADPYKGAAIYDSAGKCETRPWCTIGGTSLASPLIAAVFALSGGAHGVEYPARTLYENEIGSPGALHDIVTGSNGACWGPLSPEGIAGCTIASEAASCSGRAICLAGIGYDGPSGVGTPEGIAAFQPSPEGGGGNGGGGGPGRAGVVTAGSGGGSGGGGSSAGSKGGGSAGGSGGSSAGAAPPTGSIAQVKIRVSGLALTRAVAASGRRPRASQVRFMFTINVAAPVRATLAQRVGGRGHQRWKQLRASLTILARRGRNSRNLRDRSELSPGIYRLTLTPAHGTGQSILIQIR
jgi:hypothetical protein